MNLDPIQYMIPWTHHSAKPKRHLDWFSLFCTDDHEVSPCFIMGHPIPLKIAPSDVGRCPHLINGSLGPRESSTKTAS